jgi:hypothetical protein
LASSIIVNRSSLREPSQTAVGDRRSLPWYRPGAWSVMGSERKTAGGPVYRALG